MKYVLQTHSTATKQFLRNQEESKSVMKTVRAMTCYWRSIVLTYQMKELVNY